MKIQSITFDSYYFGDEINDYIEVKKILPTDIINITQTDNFTTLWYWGLK